MSGHPQPSPTDTGTRGAKGPPSSARGIDAPWAESRFWILELIVLALFLVRLALTVSLHLNQTSEASRFTTVALFLIPVVFAAVTFGFLGALFTSVWVTILTIPQFVMDLNTHNYAAAWTELMQVVILIVLALLVGQRVTAERRARHAAEAAQEAHLQAEALYRDLFDTNNAPILIVDANGFVVEANVSALHTFAIPAPTNNHLDAADHLTNLRLIDVIGAHAARLLLTRLVSLNLRNDEDGSIAAQQERLDDRADPFVLEVGGDVVVYRPSATALEQPGGAMGLQIVFEDVTEETQRHERMEAYAARVVLAQEEERRHIARNCTTDRSRR